MRLVARARAWLPMLPLLGILATSYWLDQQAQPEPEKPVNKDHTPDAIIDQLHAVTLNQQGQPRFVMSAKKLVHYADDDSTDLVEPDLLALSAERAPLHLSSQRGTLSHSGDVIDLMDQVSIVRAASATQAELVAHTDYLRVMPDPETVQTNRPVTVDMGGNHLSAVGMEMDNKARTLKLLAQVKANNAPIPN